jgi:hypothetical protein
VLDMVHVLRKFAMIYRVPLDARSTLVATHKHGLFTHVCLLHRTTPEHTWQARWRLRWDPTSSLCARYVSAATIGDTRHSV